MALTPSYMLELGTEAQEFTLIDALGNEFSLDKSGKYAATLVIFMCNHCPYVINMKEKLSDLARAWQGQNVQVVAINSNDATLYSEDGQEGMRADIERYNYSFPYLVDESQDVAKAYRATCTPDFFLFDSQMKLVYRGQFDTSRPGNGKPVTGADMSEAIDAVCAGTAVKTQQFPSMGCSIKWKPGKEPQWM